MARAKKTTAVDSPKRGPDPPPKEEAPLESSYCKPCDKVYLHSFKNAKTLADFYGIHVVKCPGAAAFHITSKKPGGLT